MKKNNLNPEIDRLLASESQEAIRKLVRDLPDDSLSLSWRSALNERLRGIRPEPAWKALARQSWRPALGLALAGCLALVVVLRPTSHSNGQPALEASLVKSYDDTANVEDLVGPGISVHEVADTTRKGDTSPQWTESDLNTL